MSAYARRSNPKRIRWRSILLVGIAGKASKTTLPDLDVLVLPGHGLPFYGVKTAYQRSWPIITRSAAGLIADSLAATSPRTSGNWFPVVFHKHVLDRASDGLRRPARLIAHLNIRYMLVDQDSLTAEEAARRDPPLQGGVSPPENAWWNH